MMKRCVLYSRVSTDKQQCLNQVIEMTEYTKRSNLEIVKTYQDDSTSSKKEISQRTQLSQMLALWLERAIPLSVGIPKLMVLERIMHPD